MSENLNFKVTSRVGLNDIVQIILALHKKQYLLIKVALIISVLILSMSITLDLYACFSGDLSGLPFMIFCLIFLIAFLLYLINFNKIQMKTYSKKYLGSRTEVIGISNLCFYDTYFTIEDDKNEMTLSACITISYEDVNFFVIKNNLIIFGDKTKAKSVTCIDQNAEFEIGTLEEFLQFFKNKINA